jgi:hypothetical protein
MSVLDDYERWRLLTLCELAGVIVEVLLILYPRSLTLSVTFTPLHPTLISSHSHKWKN